MKTQQQTKNKYSESELKDFDILIDKKLKQAREQLDFYQRQIADIRTSDDAKPKNLDDALVSIETERLYNLAGRQKKLIHHLENAKLRIKNRTYGICRVSGQLISKKRLAAVPHATLSITAKQRR